MQNPLSPPFAELDVLDAVQLRVLLGVTDGVPDFLDVMVREKDGPPPRPACTSWYLSARFSGDLGSSAPKA